MKKKSESGQAIILLVFAVVGLIAFTALAIDAGQLYSDRRHAQSASDAASLAGGGTVALWLDNNYINWDNFNCSLQSVTDIMNYGVYKAQERAANNDYSDFEISVSAVCEDNGPLFDEKYIDVTTEIIRQTDTALIHFAYDGPATNQVESTVRVRPTAPLAFGEAIVALAEEPCDGNNYGVIMGGSSGTVVNGGGIWSNGCMRCTGLGTANDEVPPVQVFNGGVSYVGTIQNCSNEDIEPDPQQNPEPLPVTSYTIPKPNCSHPNAITVDSITSGMTLQSNKLYCITNANNGIKITNQDLTGQYVTLYLVNGGDVEISGGTVQLSAPLTKPDPTPALPGVLIYVNPDVQPPDEPPVIKINGNSDSSYDGLIYAPSALVDLNGTSNVGDPELVEFNTQVVAYTVQITGDAIIDINYDDSLIYNKPPYLDLVK